MRKLFNELFYIPQHGTGKMREKAFLARIAVSVFAILFFLAAMGVTAYAWFSGSIVSSTNKIVAASYDLDWTITEKGEDGKDLTSSFVDKDKVELNPTDVPKDYVVEIKLGANCTASTGFCVIEVDYLDENTADETYHTAQIGKDVSVNDEYIREKYTLYIKLNQAAKITFSQYWGTSSNYPTLNDIATDKIHYLKDGETTEEKPLVLGKSEEIPESQSKEKQQASKTTTVSEVTTSSNNTGDKVTSTPSTTSDATTSVDKTPPTTSSADTTPSTQTTESTETTTPETTGTSEPTSTGEPSTSTSTSTSDSAVSQSTETSATETTDTESTEQTQPTTETTETTGAPTTEENE